MEYYTFVGIKLLVLVPAICIWLMLQTSAMTIADKWEPDVETLSKQLHDDPSKGIIDWAECDACAEMIGTVQFLARHHLNATEEELLANIITDLCTIVTKFKRWHHDIIICQGVQEFKVSTCSYMINCTPTWVCWLL